MYQNKHVPKDETPETMYEKAIRHRQFLFAATIAKDFGLGAVRVREALAKAHCAFDKAGLEEEFAGIVAGFGICICAAVTLEQAAALMRGPTTLQ